jgi:acetyl esterase/lipase
LKLTTASVVGRRIGIAVFLWAVCSGFAAAAPQSILLWPNGAPGSEARNTDEIVRVNEQGEHIVSNIHHPSITPYIAAKDKATGAAVIVIPGGGHRELWMDHEGYSVGKFLSEHGVSAFVLKYRLAREPDSTYSIEGNALQDVQRAIRLVRSLAAEWGIDPRQIGVMGFSAGGELAALASTRFDAGIAGAKDPIDREGSKPAFQALIYPAIPHDMKLSPDTPPTFLACGENDRPDIAKGIPELYLALKNAGASAELHVYAGVGHGFGMRASNRPPVSDWPQLFVEWLANAKSTKHE